MWIMPIAYGATHPDDQDWSAELMTLKDSGSSLNLEWNRTIAAYADIGETNIWFESEEDWASSLLGEDQNKSAGVTPEDVGCNCHSSSIEDELRELVFRLAEGSLGPLSPKTMTLSELFFAGLRYGSRGWSWVKYSTSPRSAYEFQADIGMLTLSCLNLHTAVAFWTPATGWSVSREANACDRRSRDAVSSGLVKAMYDCICQACGVILECPAGRLAEAAHVWEVKDGGPDVIENLLCLCPNCHALFDARTWKIEFLDGMPTLVNSLTGVVQSLRMNPAHALDRRFVNLRGT
jgi:HNH endonuclease